MSWVKFAYFYGRERDGKEERCLLFMQGERGKRKVKRDEDKEKEFDFFCNMIKKKLKSVFGGKMELKNSGKVFCVEMNMKKRKE